MAKAVCFPHSDKQFKSPADLMEWLKYDLKDLLGGYYRLGEAPSLGQLDPGSIAFFYKNSLIVGCAVVERGSHPMEEDEMARCRQIHSEDECKDLVKIVKFFTESIWVWGEHCLITGDEFREITGKRLENYVTVEPENVLKIFEAVAGKMAEMESRK